MEKVIAMTNVWAFVFLGLIAGALSGLIGIGGGIIIVPALVFLFGFSQHSAQGTTLALLIPPIGILAVWDYYKSGYVNLHAAGFICVGFFLGSFLGAKLADSVNSAVLGKIFGVALLLIAIKMLLAK